MDGRIQVIVFVNIIQLMKGRLIYYCLVTIPLFLFGACTDFQENNVPVSFGVDVDEMDFTIAPSTRSVTVSSGTKWDVSSMPSWVSLGAISQSGRSPYEWIANFSASANDEYNREGKIMIKAGSDAAEISVTQEGRKGKYIAVESVSLSPTELTLTEGENASLTYSISPANASIKDVTWESSSPSVATVTGFTGRIDAIAEGTTTITVTTNDGNKTATSTVTVKAKVIPVTGVSLDRTSLSLTEGETYSLVATVTPSNATNKSVTWSSSNTTVATVSSSGVVTAKAGGSATITVKTSDGAKTATCAVTVKAKTVAVTGVSLNKTSLTMTVGDTQTLAATVTPSNASNKSVTWSSSDTSVATVSSSGVVTAKAAGSATITVTTNDGGKKATCSVTVQAEKVAVTGVSLNKTSLSMTVGDNQTLTATVTPSNATDKSVAWSSSNTSVATVSSSGVVTAKAAGSATITVTTNDGGKKATCSVTVQAQKVAVTGVSLNKTSLSMTVGDTQTLTATVTPSNATDKSVTWSSSNTSVATVSSSGVVSALLVGSATITVTTNDGSKTAICSITVVYPTPVAVDLGLSVKWASFNVGAAKPEDSGYYFPWGVTEPVTFSYGEFFFYTLDSYKWYNSSDKSLTKYCPIANYGHNGYTDNKSVLDSNDDAAHVNLGTMWRMPTNEEFAQLKERCTWKWTSTNGVNGYRVTGPNGNSIFLPAVGFGTMMEFRNGGTQGYYWSTSLRTDYPYYSYSFSFGASSYDNESRDRSNILPIRPVTGEPTISVTGVSLNKTSLSMTVGDTQTLTATVTPSNATDKSVTWSSSNTSVATVSSSGVVTAKAAGTATITVTTNDGGKKAICSVKVNTVTVIPGFDNEDM